ncbi:unnamed protein product [Rotaria socialis]|uniref:G-protein coupled receptors family 1 profile domain-containing protein n=1 Tax=Rotaria socialis TaxID=392032 RepID=A0A818FXU4_9BILA|nr:unnamed protein product [Rotaria socialis]CAF3810512.1 unnamed protein product [Rotaria socialis]CAF4461682.1 unnamed protein product [Rotaria socialis]CAF4650284.1 unnamed protein product [Rotaria socialis]
MTGLNWSTKLIMYPQNNGSTNFTTQCAYDTGRFLRYAGTLTVILGFIGNSLSILVFSRKSLRSRSCSIYFLALSVSDIVVLVGYTLENLLWYGFGIQLLSSAFMCKSVIFLFYASTDISNYFLTLAAIDRFVLTSHGSANHHFCRESTAKLLIAIVAILFSLINCHFLYGFHVDKDGVCFPRNGTYSLFYVNHYDSYIDIVKTVLIPFIVIFLCNIFIITRLARKHKSLRRVSSHGVRRRQEKDRQLTGFLLLTSILFVVLSLPSEINDYIRTKLSDPFQMKYTCELWMNTTVLILLHQINHASHFYVYTLTGPMFRKEIQKLICYYKQSNRKFDYSGNQKRSITISRNMHIDCVDDQRLDARFSQSHSLSRVSCK